MFVFHCVVNSLLNKEVGTLTLMSHFLLHDEVSLVEMVFVIKFVWPLKFGGGLTSNLIVVPCRHYVMRLSLPLDFLEKTA